MMQGIVKGGLNDGGSNIKSIQTGATIIAASATSATATISAVDVTKSIVIVHGREIVLDTADYASFGGVITNSTTLTLNAAPREGTKTVYWTVIEFNNVKSRQSGVLSASVAGSNPVTVSSVDINKSILFYSFTSTSSTDIYESGICIGRIVSATTLGFYSYDTYKTVYWQLIEFY